MRALIILVCAIVPFLFSCNNNSKNNTSDNSIATIPSHSGSNAISIVEDTLCVPCYNAYEQSILVSEIMLHGNEVPENSERKNWYGLFKSGNNFYVDTTEIKITKCYDVIVDPDDSSEITGKLVQALHKDTSILLIGNISLSQGYKTKNLINPQRFRYPEEDTIFYNSNGTLYKLYSAAIKTKTEHYSDTGYFNYKLYLSCIKNGREVTQLLVATSHLQFESIVFIGDIDGDGVPDIIFDLAVEDASIPTLYLSRNAGNNVVLKVVAQSTYVGC